MENENIPDNLRDTAGDQNNNPYFLCDPSCSSFISQNYPLNVAQCGMPTPGDYKVVPDVFRYNSRRTPHLPRFDFSGEGLLPFNPVLLISPANKLKGTNSEDEGVVKINGIINQTLLIEIDSKDPSRFELHTDPDLPIPVELFLDHRGIPPARLFMFLSNDGLVFSNSSVVISSIFFFNVFVVCEITFQILSLRISTMRRWRLVE
jgi:hypothetical protein